MKTVFQYDKNTPIRWFDNDQFDNITECALDAAEYNGADITGVDKAWVWEIGCRTDAALKAGIDPYTNVSRGEIVWDTNESKIAQGVADWFDTIISTEEAGGCAGW